MASELEVRPGGSWSSARPTGPCLPLISFWGCFPSQRCLAYPGFPSILQLVSRIRRVEKDLKIQLESRRWLSTQVRFSGWNCSTKSEKCFYIIHIVHCLCSMTTFNSKYDTITHGSDTFSRVKRPWLPIFLSCRPLASLLPLLPFMNFPRHNKSRIKRDILTFLFVKIMSEKGQWFRSFGQGRREPGKPHGFTPALQIPISPKSCIFILAESLGILGRELKLTNSY